MSNVITLRTATCPACLAPIGTGDDHQPWCDWTGNESGLDAICSWISGDVSVSRGSMDYSKVRPSLGDFCPRTKCNLQMRRFEYEGKVWLSCQQGHYECVEIQARSM